FDEAERLGNTITVSYSDSYSDSLIMKLSNRIINSPLKPEVNVNKLDSQQLLRDKAITIWRTPHKKILDLIENIDLYIKERIKAMGFDPDTDEDIDEIIEDMLEEAKAALKNPQCAEYDVFTKLVVYIKEALHESLCAPAPSEHRFRLA